MIKKTQVDGENVYLKKSKFFGWSIIYPVRNEDGSINWFNLLTGGAWAKLILVILIVALILVAVAEYSKNITTLISCFDNPLTLNDCVQAFNPNLSMSYIP